jgi:feruloyl esterase
LSVLLVVCAATALGQSSDSTLSQPACERLALPNVSITSAQSVSAGAFAGPPQLYTGLDLSAFYKSLPAFCRIVAEAKPSSDSDIKIEVWMPVSNWSGKLQGLGNGGFAGQIDYYELGAAVKRGYAVAATDTGHAGTPIDATWALGHPEKVADFGHRGIHEMTRVAKAAIHAFYASDPKHSYFAGCSDGGREALMEAQRYPEDYDGILAGAPANFWTRLLATSVWDTQALTLDPASYIPAGKIPAVAAAVLASCDALDGVRDGILNDPRQCHFEPAALTCKGGEESDKCLTAPQAAALKKIYDGPRDSNGHQFFGYLPGAEDGPGGWGVWIVGPAPNKSLMAFFGLGYFSNMVYEEADWDYRTFALEPGTKLAAEKTAGALNAVDPNLKPFKARGGKLILYHGWEDPAIPATNTINYYQSVIAKMGQKSTDSFVRLYMVPGMQHCDGGPGPNSFGQAGGVMPDDPRHNARMALEQWVEKGAAPSTIVATKHGEGPEHPVKMTRPLCAYPQSAKYKGTGDTSDATNFVCGLKKK